MVSSTTGRRLLLACLALAFGVALAEVLGHAYFRVRRGAFLWNDPHAVQVFRISPFVTDVSDERVVAPRKNFKAEEIEFDSNGFRVGTNHYEGKATNVVFIGDSVPFGWGVSGGESVPSHFARLLERDGNQTVGVINAAVPSYSLYQAVKRYEHDVHGRFRVSAVVLQIWDPAEQLAANGSAWKREMNWAVRGLDVNWIERKMLAHRKWFKYSSLAYYGFISHLAITQKGLHLGDRETRKRFLDDNLRALEELERQLEAGGTALYLLPANPRGGLANDGSALTTALLWLNESLRTYAARSRRAHFIDVGGRFDEAGRAGLFVDDCCHLSDAGAAVEAAAIYDEMVKDRMF